MLFSVRARTAISSRQNHIFVSVKTPQFTTAFDFDEGKVFERHFDIVKNQVTTLQIEVLFRKFDQWARAIAQFSGAEGIDISQTAEDRVFAELRHSSRPILQPCRVRCPNGEWIEGPPGGNTCVRCQTDSGSVLTLCC
jgi:hypothetical protein